MSGVAVELIAWAGLVLVLVACVGPQPRGVPPIQDRAAVEPGLTLPQLHLEAALSDLAGRDPADAEHHLQHFLEQAAAPDRPTGERILDYLRRGDFHQAEHAIQDLLPRPAN